jgi:hypothetical protein
MTLDETIRQYAALVKLYPDAAYCAFCGERNDHWDESGFFYLSTRPEMKFGEGEAACKACCDGEPGAKHEALHGKGDR